MDASPRVGPGSARDRGCGICRDDQRTGPFPPRGSVAAVEHPRLARGTCGDVLVWSRDDDRAPERATRRRAERLGTQPHHRSTSPGGGDADANERVDGIGHPTKHSLDRCPREHRGHHDFTDWVDESIPATSGIGGPSPRRRNRSPDRVSALVSSDETRYPGGGSRVVRYFPGL